MPHPTRRRPTVAQPRPSCTKPTSTPCGVTSLGGWAAISQATSSPRRSGSPSSSSTDSIPNAARNARGSTASPPIRYDAIGEPRADGYEQQPDIRAGKFRRRTRRSTLPTASMRPTRPNVSTPQSRISALRTATSSSWSHGKAAHTTRSHRSSGYLPARSVHAFTESEPHSGPTSGDRQRGATTMNELKAFARSRPTTHSLTMEERDRIWATVTSGESASEGRDERPVESDAARLPVDADVVSIHDKRPPYRPSRGVGLVAASLAVLGVGRRARRGDISSRRRTQRSSVGHGRRNTAFPCRHHKLRSPARTTSAHPAR